MRQIKGPAEDSPEFAAIVRLYKLGGRGLIADLLPVMRTNYQSNSRVIRLVGDPLRHHGFVKEIDGGYELTGKGLKFAQENAPQSTSKGTTQGSKLAQLCGMPTTLRPGALDYREKPSIMGGQRVPFHAIRDKEGK